MQLTQAFEGMVGRVTPQLPAGFEFVRAAAHDLPDGDPPDGVVPDVIGQNVWTGWSALFR